MLNPNGSLITLDQMADIFYQLQEVYDEHPESIAERWEAVSIELPWAASKPIYADFTAELKDVYENGDGVRTFAAFEFVTLRWRYFGLLDSNDVNMRHVNLYEMEAMSLWQRRLGDKVDQTDEGYIDNEKYVKEVVPAVVKHSWLN